MTELNKVEIAKEKFGKLVELQLERVMKMKEQEDFINYAELPQITIGIIDGDGIGKVITKEAAGILEFLLKDEIKKGKIQIRKIDGLTIENRLKEKQTIPEYVLNEIKACQVLLKGPTETPSAGSGMPNIESANVAMRRELDLFANVRPVKVVEEGIDWTFFRENTEGGYTLGSLGIDIDQDLAFDFTVTTAMGCERVITAAFEYAKNNGKKKVSAVTKANIIKTTDGKFLNIFKKIAAKYPDIKTDDWFIDIMTAKLLDKKRRSEFEVLVMPNLYGDILTDEAAEIQGGVGTAGSANIGKRYAMFEAIHGSASRMIEEGRGDYADPSSIIKAGAMLLEHIGYKELCKKLESALEICAKESKVKITGHSDGATCAQFGSYVVETLQRL